MKKRLRAAALLFVGAVTFCVPLLSGNGGTAFKQPEPIVAHADETAYGKVAVDLATATAFDDVRNAIKAAPKGSEEGQADYMQSNFDSSLVTLTSGNHWGNVGLFVGPKGSSKNSDTWSTFRSNVSIDNSQIEAFDTVAGNSAFSKYKAFGGAVQKLNARSQKTQGSSNSMQKGLDELSAAGAKLTNLGTELISDYNPAPIVLCLIDANELNTHPDNKLVALVNSNANLKEVATILGSPTSFGVPLSFLIMGITAFLLLVTSVLMTLINGRAAGENIRKMMVKILIGSVAVPLIAKGLDAGISFLDTSAAVQAASPENNYVQQNLNLADWYACGFALPSGVTIEINKKGQFVFDPSDVQKINEFTYQKVWGETPTADKMVDKMEEYYNLFKALPMTVGFSEPVKVSGGSKGKPWKTENFYKVLDNFGAGKPLTDGIENIDAGGKAPAMANVGYFMENGLNMSGSNGAWTITGDNQLYGISPIAATNLMRTSFTGSAMTVNSNSTMGGVVFDVDNGPGVGTAKMSSITRFLATFALVMAAMKGLFTIFSAGFAGIVSGGAKSALGSSSGFGQAVGGIIALVGGIFGISIIMTLSFTLLDQLYGVMQTLLSGTSAGNDILEPFKEAVEDIRILGPLLGDAMKSVARFVLTILCALTLPKLGGIPVTLFCQYLAELPHRFAERAQQIENKFTGDFRGGAGGRGAGGGMASAGALTNQAVNSGKAQAMGMLQGAGAALGALGGLGLTKLGGKLGEKYEGKDTGDSDKSMNSPENDAPNGEEALKPTEAEAAAAAAAADDADKQENGQADGADTDRDEQAKDAASGDKDSGSMVMNQNIDGNDLKESEHDSLQSNDAGDSMEYSDSEQLSDSESDAMEALSSDERGIESSMSDSSSESDAYGEQTLSSDLASEDNTLSDTQESQMDSAESSAMATLSAESDTTVEKDGKGSLSGDGSSPASASSSSAMSGTAGSEKAGTARTASMNGAGSASGGKSPQALTKEQKHNRRMQALAKGLQAAGGHTTTGQAMAGVAAGVTHMAGSRVGAQNITGKGVSAVRNYRQRQNDIRQGLPGNYSQTQRQQNTPKKTPGTGRNPNASHPENGQGVSRNPGRASRQYAEALAREAELRAQEADAADARRRERN